MKAWRCEREIRSGMIVALFGDPEDKWDGDRSSIGQLRELFGAGYSHNEAHGPPALGS